MVESITISNFLSIREEFTLSFVASRERDNRNGMSWTEQHGSRKLSKMLFLLGRNAVGKSNIIAAVRYLQRLVISHPTERDASLVFLPFKLDNTSQNKPTNFEIIYYIGDRRYIYTINYNASVILSESLVLATGSRRSEVYSRYYDRHSDLTHIEFGVSAHINAQDQLSIIKATKNNTSVLAAFWNLNIGNDILKTNYLFFRDKLAFNLASEDNLADLLSSGTKKEQKKLKQLIIIFLQLIQSNIRDYQIFEHHLNIPKELLTRMSELNQASDYEEIFKNTERTFKTVTFFHGNNKGVFPIEEDYESDGTLQLIRLIAMGQAIIDKDITVFLDEDYDTLHEIASKYLVLCYMQMSRRCQLVMAGQNTSFLEAKEFRRDSIRVINKDQGGNTFLVKPTNEFYMKNSNFRNYIYRISGVKDGGLDKALAQK